jgi:cell division protein FtsZ
MDMGIGEFEEVGNTVKEFASENATVVVGTVIDPDMTDDLRVTVVATGLGETARERVTPVTHETPQVRVVNSDVADPSPSDYRDMDSPTVIRRDRQMGKSYGDPVQQQEMDYLDIPAFLRRQAD